MKVRELVEGLFARFPACDAEPWDHVGLSVGDPDAEAGRILVTLDATFPCVRGALDAGADVIVSHHPVYIKAPDLFAPAPGKAVSQASAAVYAAARNGVSIVSMHTNLDRSVAARTELARLIGMSVSGSLEHPDDPGVARGLRPRLLRCLRDRPHRMGGSGQAGGQSRGVLGIAWRSWRPCDRGRRRRGRGRRGGLSCLPGPRRARMLGRPSRARRIRAAVPSRPRLGARGHGRARYRYRHK